MKFYYVSHWVLFYFIKLFVIKLFFYWYSCLFTLLMIAYLIRSLPAPFSLCHAIPRMKLIFNWFKKNFKYLCVGICPTLVVLHGVRVFITSSATLTAASSYGVACWTKWMAWICAWGQGQWKNECAWMIGCSVQMKNLRLDFFHLEYEMRCAWMIGWSLV